MRVTALGNIETIIISCYFLAAASLPMDGANFRSLLSPPRLPFEDNIYLNIQNLLRQSENVVRPNFGFQISFSGQNQFYPMPDFQNGNYLRQKQDKTDTRVLTNFDYNKDTEKEHFQQNTEKLPEYSTQAIESNEIINEEENVRCSTVASTTTDYTTETTNDCETTTFLDDGLALRTGVSGNVVASLLG